MSPAKFKRPGPIKSNGFLNFMSIFRSVNCASNPQKTIVDGAKCWSAFSKEQKRKFCKMRRRLPLSKFKGCKRNQRKTSLRKKHRMTHRWKRPKRSRRNSTKLSPLVRNPFFNFLRSFRRRNIGLKPDDLLVKGAYAWCRLCPERKDFYQRMTNVKKVAGSSRMKRSRNSRVAKKSRKGHQKRRK